MTIPVAEMAEIFMFIFAVIEIRVCADMVEAQSRFNES